MCESDRFPISGRNFLGIKVLVRRWLDSSGHCAEAVAVGTDDITLRGFGVESSEGGALGDVTKLSLSGAVVKLHHRRWVGETTVHAGADLEDVECGA